MHTYIHTYTQTHTLCIRIMKLMVLILWCRSFGVKEEIFCLFQGVLHNLGSLRQEYGLAKSADEVVLIIEAYKALRDRAPYPPSHVVGHLVGNFSFVVFDASTSTLFVASVSIPFQHRPFTVSLGLYTHTHIYAFIGSWTNYIYVNRINLERFLCTGELQPMDL